MQEGGRSRNWKVSITALSRLEQISGLDASLVRHFKDGSFSCVMPKALVSFDWDSKNRGTLSLTKGQWIGIVGTVPHTSYLIGLLPSPNPKDRVSFRGTILQAKMGFFPKEIVQVLYPILLDYSPRTYKLKVQFTYWPWNRFGVYLGSYGGQLN